MRPIGHSQLEPMIVPPVPPLLVSLTTMPSTAESYLTYRLVGRDRGASVFGWTAAACGRSKAGDSDFGEAEWLRAGLELLALRDVEGERCWDSD